MTAKHKHPGPVCHVGLKIFGSRLLARPKAPEFERRYHIQETRVWLDQTLGTWVRHNQTLGARVWQGRQTQVTWVWKGMLYPRNVGYIVIIIKFEKKILLLKKNHRFDLKL